MRAQHIPNLADSKDPLHAQIPALRGGELGAVYYGQRRSGDFYDFVRCSAERVLFGLFDVAGGLDQARPVMYALQQRFRSLTVEYFADHGNELESLTELWIQLNREVMRSAGGVHACAAFIACYNEHQQTVSYVNAGHTPGLVRDGDRILELKATALPLGLFSHGVPDSSVIALTEGDTLLLVSRGIVEARRRSEEFGLDGAKRYLLELDFDTAHETCVGLVARVQQFMQTAPTHNDVTAVSLIRRPVPSE